MKKQPLNQLLTILTRETYQTCPSGVRLGISHPTEVLESIPLKLSGQSFYVFVVPHGASLGKSFDTYENVQVKVFDDKLQEHEATGVEYFSSGNLGKLHGGLLNMSDYRAPITAEDLSALQAVQFESNVANHRRHAGVLC